MIVRGEHREVDALFERWRDRLGPDSLPYRNHVYRVLNIAAEISGAAGDDFEKLALAAAFHDAGIWLDATFNYLEPSAQRAEEHVRAVGKDAWADAIGAIIRNHHKVLPWHGAEAGLVEAFRRADWLDVCLFLVPGRVPRGYLAELLQAFPRAGFHQRLLALGARWCQHHPLRPLPMLRL